MFGRAPTVVSLKIQLCWLWLWLWLKSFGKTASSAASLATLGKKEANKSKNGGSHGGEALKANPLAAPRFSAFWGLTPSFFNGEALEGASRCQFFL